MTAEQWILAVAVAGLVLCVLFLTIRLSAVSRVHAETAKLLLQYAFSQNDNAREVQRYKLELDQAEILLREKREMAGRRRPATGETEDEPDYVATTGLVTD